MQHKLRGTWTAACIQDSLSRTYATHLQARANTERLRSVPGHLLVSQGPNHPHFLPPSLPFSQIPHFPLVCFRIAAPHAPIFEVPCCCQQAHATTGGQHSLAGEEGARPLTPNAVDCSAYLGSPLLLPAVWPDAPAAAAAADECHHHHLHKGMKKAHACIDPAQQRSPCGWLCTRHAECATL